MSYFSIWTAIGLAKRAAAELGGPLVTITQMAFGDGNGAEIVPDPAMIGLVREVHRVDMEVLYADPDNPNWIWAEAVVPMAAGPWWIREVGLYDADGDLVAVSNYPSTYKPTLAGGAGKDLYLRLCLAVDNTAVIELAIDPSVVMASREYVNGVAAGLETKILAARRLGFFYNNTL
jgi:phage-related tail fiber protein